MSNCKLDKGIITGRFRNLLSRRKPQHTERLEVTSPAAFSSFGVIVRDPYANDVYRSAVDAIARLSSKLVLQPVISFSDGTTAKCDDRLSRLLQVEPNPLMTAYDMIYKAVTHLYTRNNAYIYIYRNDAGEVTGLYPMNVRTCEYRVDPAGNVYCQFTFDNGKTLTFLYSDIIHLRRHFNGADVAGDANDAIAAGLELADAQNKGIVASIQNGANLRGVVSFNITLPQEKLKANRDAFMADFMNMSNNGGVAAVDNTMTYTPLHTDSVTISSEDLKTVQRKVYDYLGISEQIVNATYTDDEFGAFNENIIEPLSLQIELEFTRKLFTPLQVARGREIRVMNSRLQFISNKNKVNLLKELVPLGMVTINEARDLMGMPPVEDGNRRIQSLNFVNQELVDKYQLFKSKNGTNYSLTGVPKDESGNIIEDEDEGAGEE